MSMQITEDQGAAKNNEAIKIASLSSNGPVLLMAHNLGDNEVVLRCEIEGDGAFKKMEQDTLRAAEDSAYDGDESETDFSGKALSNLPIVPGTVRVLGLAPAPDLVDRDGDGVLYTDDDDEDEAGSIDYFSGALELSYPTGKAPGSGNIDVDYYSQDAALNPRGKKTYQVSNVGPGKTLVIKAAANGLEGARVKVTAAATMNT